MTMPTQASKQVVEGFWMAMQTNDFKSVGKFLHDDYMLEWPQSGELIRGRENFVAVNEHYPAHGRWEFAIHRILADEDKGCLRCKCDRWRHHWEGNHIFHDTRWKDRISN